MDNFEVVLKMLKEGVDYFEAIELIKEEAATVARVENYQLMIYPEPLGNPSFHVKYKDEWEVVLEMFTFKILESKHGKFKKGNKLPKKIVDDIYAIILQKKNIGVITWKYMLQTWNDNNPKYPVDLKKNIPKNKLYNYLH